jgi:hypothetical protein
LFFFVVEFAVFYKRLAYTAIGETFYAKQRNF